MRRRQTREEKIRAFVLRRRRAADYSRRRRAEKLGAETEHVSLDDVVARDGDACYLCGRETDRDDRTLDHVVPLTRGGGHTLSNVRVAHRRCNSKKGARLLGEIDFREW